MRYKIWRTKGAWAHSMYVLIPADSPEGPEPNWRRVPESVRDGKVWTGHGVGGLLSRLKPLYRDALAAHGFVVLPGLDAAQPAHLERPPRRRIRLQPGRFKPISPP